jgi:hypothetical protein
LGRVEKFERSERFTGRGNAAAVPRPEILFSLSLKDNFDPPKGGWSAISQSGFS